MVIVRKCIAMAAVCTVSASAFGQVLNAHPGPANNGGSAGWAIFFDLTSLGQNLWVTEMTTASSAAAGAAFNVEIFTRTGSGLGGPVGSGPGSSSAGWTSLGVTGATQGAVSSQISLPIDIPDIAIGAGQTVGVAALFTMAGPRYVSSTGAYTVYADANLELTTGDARSSPFTTGGSWFSPRLMAGSVTYSNVPEPATFAIIGIGVLGLALARRSRG